MGPIACSAEWALKVEFLERPASEPVIESFVVKARFVFRGSFGISKGSVQPNDPRPKGTRLSWMRFNEVALSKRGNQTRSGNFDSCAIC
jgi:hypothetical protein